MFRRCFYLVIFFPFSSAAEPKRTKIRKVAKQEEKPAQPKTPKLHNGTKMGNLIHCLKKLWTRDPSSRVIIFSQYNSFLQSIGAMLADSDIESAFVGGNVFRRRNAIRSFKAKDSSVRVILLSLESAASGSNLIEATHVILMDPVKGTKEEALATESQAIGRAHRQGQTNQITIVRFVVKNTVEYTTYVKNYFGDDEQLLQQATNSGRPKVVRSDSVGTILANTPSLFKKSKSITELVENMTE